MDTLLCVLVFVIDSNKKIRLILTYPASTGRNFTELLRVIDSLQMTDKTQVHPRKLEARRRRDHRAVAPRRSRTQAPVSCRVTKP